MKISVGKLGAIPSREDKRTFKFSTVQRALAVNQQLKAPRPFYDNRHPKFQPSKWPILGNDRYGCCTIAGIVRIMMLRAAFRGQTLPIDDHDVIAAYLDMTGGVDSGAMCIEALTYMREVGIKGYKVHSFVRVADRDIKERRSALQTFGALYVAAGLPLKLDEDRDHRLELTPVAARDDRDAPRSMGGHAYNIFGAQSGEEFAVMWRDNLIEEDAWTNLYREETWAFIDNQETDEALIKVMEEQLAVLKST